MPTSKPRKQYADQDEAYEGTRRWVYKLAHAFHRRHGGDYEETEARAFGHWVRAWRTYDASQAAFTTHVKNVVWRGLTDDLRRDRNRLSTGALGGLQPQAPGPHPLDGLSETGTIVVRLVLKSGRGKRPAAVRRLAAKLLLELGVAGEQVIEAFKEIREALRG